MAAQSKRIKLVKQSQSLGRERKVEVVVAEQPNDWSKSIQSWIKEFRRQQQATSFPAFDSLFKEKLKSEPKLPTDKDIWSRN
jgi:hypothetical protein